MSSFPAGTDKFLEVVLESDALKETNRSQIISSVFIILQKKIILLEVKPPPIEAGVPICF